MEKKSNTAGCCGTDTVLERDPWIMAAAGDLAEQKTAERLKEMVRERYGNAAKTKAGCGCGCSGEQNEETFSFVTEDYAEREGYVSDADLGLGCGVPTDVAGIQPGDTVLDLGSGAGIDAFIARQLTGPEGSVIGVDFTPEMIAKARKNADKLAFENVRFVKGDIENLPVESESVDVILSNCVLNLVPDKKKAFAEMYRVLKQGGHFTVSDIVVQGHLPERLRESAALYAGCVSGAIAADDYLQLLLSTGFEAVHVVKERKIEIADDILHAVASPEEVADFRRSGGILSVTVIGTRPADQ